MIRIDLCGCLLIFGLQHTIRDLFRGQTLLAQTCYLIEKEHLEYFECSLIIYLQESSSLSHDLPLTGDIRLIFSFPLELDGSQPFAHATMVLFVFHRFLKEVSQIDQLVAVFFHQTLERIMHEMNG